MSFSTTTIPDECCTKTCLNPFLSLHNFFTFFIVLLHIVSTVLQYMNTVYTNVDPACVTDCGYQIVVSSPIVQILLYYYSNNLRGDKSLIIAMKSMNAADITTQHDKFVQGLVLCVSKLDFHAPIISGNTELKRSREKQRLKIQRSVTHDG